MVLPSECMHCRFPQAPVVRETMQQQHWAATTRLARLGYVQPNAGSCQE
jgi:hypothetical protein